MKEQTQTEKIKKRFRLPQRKTRFLPVTQELGAYLKLYLICWLLAGIVIFVILRGGYWAFWGAIGLGFFAAIPVFFLGMLLTGSKENK